MKILKEFLFKFSLLVIFGLIYYFITGKDLFSLNILSFMSVVIVFIIIELLYTLVDRKTNLFKQNK